MMIQAELNSFRVVGKIKRTNHYHEKLMKKILMALTATLPGMQTGCSKPPEATGISMPACGEWQVFWGGKISRQNHHHDVPSQRYALDLVISTDQEGYKTYQNSGKSNQDYYCWGVPVLSPFNGTVVISVDGIPDNIPGEFNEQMVYGNTVMIQGENGIVSLLAHLKNGSIAVKVGEQVRSGQKIGECGNSGNSSEPHLHFHIQTEVGFEKGVGMLPVFNQLVVNGEVQKNHSPIKNEKIEGVQDITLNVNSRCE